MTKETGGPAFPAEFVKYKPGEVGNEVPIMAESSGMTLRDYFAAKAMQGICASGPTIQDAHIAGEAYRLADAMLEARK